MNSFKRIAAIIVTLVMFITMLCVPQTSSASAIGTMRDITATELVAEMTVGINVGNSLDSACVSGQDETAWGNPRITKQLIQAYKNAGFNTIRLPVTWRGNIDSTGVPYTAWFDRVQEVVDMIMDEGLYCILNTHHEQNWLNTNSTGMDTRKAKFANLWNAIGERFEGYGDHLLFEAFNEILYAESDWNHAVTNVDYNNCNTLAQIFVDSVRATGGNNEKRILIISTYGAGSSASNARNLVLPTDTAENKLAVEFHTYSPQSFCFREGSQSTWIPNNADNSIKDSCELFNYLFTQQGVPVILGEFGAVNKNNTSDRAAYVTDVISYCKQFDITPIWWDNGVLSSSKSDAFGLVDRYTYEVAYPEIIKALVNISANVTQPTTVAAPTSTTTTKTDSVNPTKDTTSLYVSALTGLKAQMLTATSLELSWNSTDADYYSVYRAVGNGDYAYHNNVYSNSITDIGLLRGKTYSYRVVACKEYSGNIYQSNYSSVVKVTTLAKNISKVTKKVLKKAVSIKIGTVIGADGYEIRYGTKKSLKGAKKKIFKKTTVKLKKLKKNKKYYVSVRAFKTIDGKKVYTKAKKLSVKTKK